MLRRVIATKTPSSLAPSLCHRCPFHLLPLCDRHFLTIEQRWLVLNKVVLRVLHRARVWKFERFWCKEKERAEGSFSVPWAKGVAFVQLLLGRSHRREQAKTMEEDIKNRGDACPRLLDLIPVEKDWLLIGSGGGGGKNLKASEEKDLELRLGPPGERSGAEEEQSSALCLGFFSKASKSTTVNPCAGVNRGFLNSAAENTGEDHHQKQHGGLVQAHSRAGLRKEETQRTNGTAVKAEQHGLERKVPHVAPRGAVGSTSGSQTRNASVAVVGWPPIRSFRKNLANTSTKPSVEATIVNLVKRENTEESKKGLFVKINMDGIPIGRKVNLIAYDSYEKLSVAVKELFQVLLEAQKDLSAGDVPKSDEQVFAGLLDGTGEYTMVYEDTEGDKMLVGDVPWDVFVSTAKRLRVLKSSDISVLRLGAVCRKRAATEC